MACRGCLECLLKLFNFLMSVAGLAMVGYGIYLFVAYKRAADVVTLLSPVGSDQNLIELGRPMLMALSVSSDIFDHLPKEWFIYLFFGVGVVLFVISCCGCIGASARNLCCLSCYSLLVFLLILVELGCAAFIVFNKSWKHELPADQTGYFDMIYHFLEENWSIARWVALGIVILQVLIFLLALMVRAANAPADYDSDDEFIAQRQQIRQPLMHRQQVPVTGVPVAGGHDQRPGRADAWSARMREKYGLDTSEFTYNPSESHSVCGCLGTQALFSQILIQEAMRNRRGKPSEASFAFWPSIVMKKWLNIKPKVYDFSEDEVETETESEDDDSSFTSHRLKHRRGKSEPLRIQYMNTKDVRVTIGTWNVAGRLPCDDLHIDDWLRTDEPADIYVIGFQEVVPLNAGNVLGAEDNKPIPKWEAIIRRTLNKSLEPESKHRCYSAPPSPCSVADVSTDEVPGLQLEYLETANEVGQNFEKGIYGFDCETGLVWPEDENQQVGFFSETSGDSFLEATIEEDDHDRTMSRSKYVRIVSKQMVGIYISVWVRKRLRKHVSNLKVSPVGVGLMGYLGNKDSLSVNALMDLLLQGSVSVSMNLFQSRLCFVCSHLTSGQKDGAEQRRNSDVYEIIRRTHFSSVVDTDQTQTIPSHDQIFWFGDLNYRLNMSDAKVRKLVALKRWDELLNNDQLHNELRGGHVFDGWNEGIIDFPPTYKYEIDSDRYVGEIPKEGEKKRSPAWCDRILWSGVGIKQLRYQQAEIRLSDHRPVSSMFLIEVEVLDHQKLQRALNFSTAAVHPEIFFDENGDLEL
ncbi:hypothetical protein V6N11_009572 [Hibiscus sabdariffa]|uniref:Inositol polyphosphate-related phosphatase domain-containing protein n=1 Tax=Hibiscus sabdariffa TaxID=183260 RepID=A0ABR2P5U6_9ROSI